MMDRILQDYRQGKISLEKAKELLSNNILRMGFANLDIHRQARKGFAEVVYCAGKTPVQAEKIFLELMAHNDVVMGTRATMAHYEKLKNVAKFDEEAGIIYHAKNLKKTGKVLVVCAGTSDIPIAQEAALTAELTGSNVVRKFDIGVAGIHRLQELADDLDAKAIVAVAGMEGALPTVVSGLTRAPVIAVPTSVGYGVAFEGIAPLLTMLNSCSPGVAVVNIDNGFGAGYMASMINRQSK